MPATPSYNSTLMYDAQQTLAVLLRYGVRQTWRLAGLGLQAAMLFLFAALISYQVSDPSLNTGADAGQISNWGGAPGARWADLLLQNLGLGAIGLLIVGFVHGRHLWRGEVLEGSPARRVLYLVLAVLCLAIAGARLPSFGFVPQPYFGGAVGMIGLNALSGWSQAWFGPWVHILVAMVCFGLGFVLACLAAGVRVRSALARLVLVALVTYDYACHAVLSAQYAYRRWRATDEIEEIEAPVRPRRRAKVVVDEDETPEGEEGDQEEIDEDEEAVQPRRSLGDIKVVRPSASKPRKKQSKQMQLGEAAEDFELPALELLQDPPAQNAADVVDEDALRKNADMLQNVLSDYNVRGDIVSIHPGPVVTLYELEPAPGTKSSRVIGLSDDIARSMAAVSVRAAVVPGRNVIGIELPNKKRQTVYLRELLQSDAYINSTAKLALVLGKDIGGHPIIADLARMPHLLVAGTTGSGKSVAINTMILSLIYRLTPAQCRFIMIDPKMLELSAYDDIPHLLSPVVTEPGKAIVALKWAVQEMENRYRAMSKLGVRNIEGYNARLAEARENGEELTRKVQTGFDPETGQPVYEDQPLDLTALPYIVVIVDEFADLMLVAGKDVESAIQRLAQMARAAGIHLIMATQRPSVDVITGVIKANFPTRISFQVTSKFDSRTILQEGGAEQLLGMGDMLYMAAGGRLTRVHGPFVSDGEVEQVVDHVREQGTPEYLDDVTSEDGEFGGLFGEGDAVANNSVDEMYDQAVALVSREGKASTSFVQRHLQIGYNRAARIIEEMEKQGVISAPSHSGKREVLVGDHSGRH
jgi:DNA segregation ATPase FtsK/SpoIIIE, S-DNA-T family